jgi:hypothetical protein
MRNVRLVTILREAAPRGATECSTRRLLRASRKEYLPLILRAPCWPLQARCINVASTVTAMTAARRATTPGSRRVGRGAWMRAPSRSASASAASCSPCCGMCAAFASCLSWREALVDTCAVPEPCGPAIRPERTPTYPSHLRRRVSLGCPAQDGEVSRSLGCGPRTCTRLACAYVASGAAGHARLRADHTA